ncbi:MAG TPA: bifunctional serine/threonine-protein kinase/formylglycine-generating enzyme family protein [Pirellulales bacterium]|nr:bifunctional serine/threonine-protein kinase/formylglycine-generating enzyme family protein [Pirellulales bacterium]
MNGPGVSTKCPQKDELARFSRGELPAGRVDEVAMHLDRCSQCQSLLVAVDGTTDNLLAELRQIPTLTATQDDPFGAEIAELESNSADWMRQALQERRSSLTAKGVPTRLGEYLVSSPIGSGGMGTVYRAVHVRLQKEVALKVLSPARFNDPRARIRFEREMRAVGKLSHPNIVAATDAGEAEGVIYLVMELVGGMDLARVLQRHGPLPVPEACELMRQTAVGLDYAHSHGMVHRDVKPSNLLLSGDPNQPSRGSVKLVDLGLALLNDVEAESGTSTNVLIGSLDYMAPEQANDAHKVDHRADLYSLGCTLFELLTGRPPFSVSGGQGRLQKIEAHARSAIPSLKDECPDAPPALDALVGRLLAKDPARRFATAGDLATALQPFCAGADLAPLLDLQAQAAPARTASSIARRPRRKWGIVAGGLAAMLAAAVIYVQTDRGTVEISTDDQEVQVRIERGGELVTILDQKQNKEVRLRSGAYEVKLGQPDEDLSLNANGFTLTRGGREIVTVRRRPPPMPQSPFDGDDAKAAQVRWARYVGTTPQLKDGIGMELRFIPPGAFSMEPGYQVKLSKPFFLGAYEVTLGQFRQFVEATHYQSEVEMPGRGGFVIGAAEFMEVPGVNWRTAHRSATDDYPVTCITFNDAERFCAWLSDREKKTYRLPTEAEWAWACRAGTQAQFPSGDDEQLVDQFEWHRDNSDKQPHPVGQRKPNAWGLFDINGNAVEWCRDWHLSTLPQAVVTDPAGPAEASMRVLRGGSFFDGPFQSSLRGCFVPNHTMTHLGFRVCREP